MDIVRHLRAQGVTTLSFVDYLVCVYWFQSFIIESYHLSLLQAYLPLFTGIHDAIVGDPLNLPFADLSHLIKK